MVSDFYLWMHILNGMGKTQEWITSMTPQYLVGKYGRKDMASGFIHETHSRNER